MSGESKNADLEPGLALRDVRLVLGRGDAAVTALDGVGLTVAAGEFVAVVGPSGSGKSSLLAVAGALRAPDSGTVRIGGVEAGGMTERGRTRLRRERVGYMFQQANLFAALTVREQLLLGAHVRGRVTAAQRERAADLIAAVGLGARAGRRPHELSGGERQRTGLARALMGEPAVLLVDEPTAALDRERARQVVELLAAQTRERRTATVMVTHDREVLDLADRVLELRDGRLTG